MSPLKHLKYKKRTIPLRKGPRSYRRGKKTSEVWNFFVAVPPTPGEEDNPRSNCTLCGEVFKCPGGSTTGMRGHLDRKHPGLLSSNSSLNNSALNSISSIKAERVERVERVEPPGGSPHTNALALMKPIKEFDHEGLEDSLDVIDHLEISETIAGMCSIDLRPMSSVRTLGFNSLVSCFDPPYTKRAARPDMQFSDPNSALTALHRKELTFAKRDIAMAKRVAVSVEIFNDTNVHGYLLFTVAYVDRVGDYCKKLVRAIELQPTPEGGLLDPTENIREIMGQRIREVLQEFGLETKQSTVLIYSTGIYGKPLITREENNLIIFPCLTELIKQSFVEFQETAKRILNYDLFSLATVIAKRFSEGEYLLRNPYALLLTMLKNKEAVATGRYGITLKVEYLDGFLCLLSPLAELIEDIMKQPNMLLGAVIPRLLQLAHDLKRMEPMPQVLFNNAELKFHKGKTNEQVVSLLVAAILEPFEAAYNIDLNRTHVMESFLSIASFVHPRYKNMVLDLPYDQSKGITERVVRMSQYIRRNPLTVNFKTAFLMADPKNQVEIKEEPGTSQLNKNPGVRVEKRKRGRPSKADMEQKRLKNSVQDWQVEKWLRPPVEPIRDAFEWMVMDRSDADYIDCIQTLGEAFLVAPAVAAQHTFYFSKEFEFENKHATLRAIEPENLEKILVLNDAYDKSMDPEKFTSSYF